MLNDFTAILASLTAFAVASMLLPRVAAFAIVFCWDLGYFNGSTYPVAKQGEESVRINPLPIRRSWMVKPMPKRAATRPRVDSPSNPL